MNTTAHYLPFLKSAPAKVLAVLAVVAAIAAALQATPAHATTVTAYKGKTEGGGRISFRLAGNTISHLSGGVPTVCLETMGSHQSTAGAELFQPPGRFRLGRTTQIKALQPAAMNQGIKATKTYTLRATRARAGRVKGRLRLSFSFLRPGPSIYQSYIYICSSSVSFSAKEAS